MRLLVLGGTAWLGGEVVRAALQRGVEVTCLARGASGALPPRQASWVSADRTHPDAYKAVREQDWDVVLDVSRQPGQVRSAVAVLTARTRHWVFISSSNVYARHDEPGGDETEPVLAPLQGDVMESMETYGEAKVACEQHVLNRMGADRSLIARVGLIGGPGDIFDRSGYWPLRFSRPARSDGAVLVPDAPNLPAQLIDVRDLAGWLVDAGLQQTSGTMNVTGPTMLLPQHLEVARAVAGHEGQLVPASPAWLRAHQVDAWMGPRSMPLWLDDLKWRGFNARDSSRAHRQGLITRPLEQTLGDTLEWEQTRPFTRRRAGLADAAERSLLDELAPLS